jgi:hypothetical protein
LFFKRTAWQRNFYPIPIYLDAVKLVKPFDIISYVVGKLKNKEPTAHAAATAIH